MPWGWLSLLSVLLVCICRLWVLWKAAEKEGSLTAVQLNRWHAFLDQIPAAAVVKDAAGPLVYLNRTAARMYGKPVEDCLGLTDWDLWPEPIAREICRQQDNVLATGKPAEGLIDLPDSTGRTHRCLTLRFPFDGGNRTLVASVTLDVTARHQAEEALRQSERSFRTFFSQAVVGMATTGMDGILDMVNPAFCEMVGYTAEELKGISFATLTHPDDLETCWREMGRLRSGDAERIVFEKRYLAKNGSIVWARNSAVILRDNDGQPLQYVTVSENITASKLAGQALADSEQRFRTAFFGSAIGMAIATQDRVFTQVNRAFCEISGYTEAELRGMKLQDLTLPEDIARRDLMVERLLAREVPSFRIEERYRRKDGRVVWIRANVSLLEAQGRAAVLLNIAEDISERIRAAEALRQSEDRFRNAFAGAAIGLTITDVEGRFTHVNAAYCAITGYSEEELRGEHWQALSHADDLEPASSLRKELLSGVRSDFILERRYVTKSGEIVSARTSSSVLRDDSGAPSGVLTITEDITSQKHAEEALRRSEEMFRVAAENASDLIYVWDMKTDKLEVIGNPGRLGMSRDELPSTFSAFRQMIHPDDRALLEDAIEEHYRTGNAIRPHFRIIKPNGEEIILESRGTVFWNTSGDTSKWIGVVSNVTERHRDEQALSRLAAIVESSEDAIIGTDLEWRIQTWNGGAESLYGYSAEEAVGQPLLMLAPGGTLEVVLEPLRSVEGGGSVNGMEATHVTKEGAAVPVSISISPVRGKSRELMGFSLIARNIGERKRSERQLLHQALHDQLTGLPNRRLFLDRLEEVLAHSRHSGRMAAVIFIDLDSFKLVNDTLGHAAGDRLLQVVAERLGSCTRPYHTLARTGGDEFSIVGGGFTTRDAVRGVAESVLAALKAPLQIAGNELFIGASIGISVAPADGDDADALQRHADAAMYDAKRAGKNQIRFFTRRLSEAARDRLDMENRLRRALERSELRLFFQPQFAVHNDTQPTRFEALLRWHPPLKRGIPPTKFIPVAEDTGLIVPIGAWVLREACMRARDWQRTDLRGVGVAVNVSAVQFSRPDFLDVLKRTLDETGLDPRLLELELTETVLIRDLRESAAALREVQALGVTAAIDDFGTGYSSLSYLQKLRLDALKIDKSFLAGVETEASAAAMLHSLVSLAHSLGMRVVAEGVETWGQFGAVRGAGADEVQGFLLGIPSARLDVKRRMPPDAAPAIALPGDIIYSVQPAEQRLE